MTLALEKPSVFMTPISLMRSRTDCPIVFAVTSSIVKNTAVATAVTIAPMLPIWLAKPWMNAFSVVVLVSVEELANSASIVRAISAERVRIVDAHDDPADRRRVPNDARLVEILVVEVDGSGCRRCGVVDAGDLHVPDIAAVLLREDVRAHRNRVADLPAEAFREQLADDRAGAIAAATRAFCSGGSEYSG